MTNEEKFKKGIVLYEIENDYILELWGGSTKHPDCLFRFSDFEKMNFEIIEEKNQLFQWVLECASKLTFPFTAKRLTEWALENLIYWEN